MDRSNNDRGFCSFRDASTVHSRANAATSAVSAASFCFFLDDRREKGRIDAVRASCISQLRGAFVERWYSVQLFAAAHPRFDSALLALGHWLAPSRVGASTTYTSCSQAK